MHENTQMSLPFTVKETVKMLNDNVKPIVKCPYPGNCLMCDAHEGSEHEKNVKIPPHLIDTVPDQKTFIKADGDKNRLELLPFAALEEVGKVMTFGAKKYKDHNWRRCPTMGRYSGAALRHLFAWIRGEDNDPETGLSHIAHASCCCLFLLGLILDGKAVDDRDKLTK